MKILSLSTVPLLPYLGSGKTRLMWTQGLRDRGHEVTVLQPVDFEFLPFIKKATQLRSAIGIFLKLRKVLKATDYDLIEFYGDQYWLFLWWAKGKHKQRSTVFVAHVDGLELNDMDKGLKYYELRAGLKKIIYLNTHYRFAKLNFKLAARYVCGCLDDLDYALKKNIFDPGSSVCISPGIDDLFHQIPYIDAKEKVIMFLGTWNARKGISNIPEVIIKTLSLFLDYKFHVYGAWSSRDLVISLFPDNLKDRVIVFDKLSTEDLLEEIKRSSIYFFPSYSEGFGLATVEAMSCSCVVVTTKTGIGSQLIDGEEALLVEFDDKSAMINALHKLIINEELRKKIAYNGFLRAKGFKWDKQIAKLEDAYIKWLHPTFNN